MDSNLSSATLSFSFLHLPPPWGLGCRGSRDHRGVVQVSGLQVPASVLPQASPPLHHVLLLRHPMALCSPLHKVLQWQQVLLLKEWLDLWGHLRLCLGQSRVLLPANHPALPHDRSPYWNSKEQQQVLDHMTVLIRLLYCSTGLATEHPGCFFFKKGNFWKAKAS